jgi:hypothetical protein
MPDLRLVAWQISRTASTERAAGQSCPRCRTQAEWSPLEERRRLTVLGAGVGRVLRRELVACRACGTTLPAARRRAQRLPSPHPVPA